MYVLWEFLCIVPNFQTACLPVFNGATFPYSRSTLINNVDNLALIYTNLS